jgi:hypothetical protein
MPLTDAKIKAAKAKDKQCTLNDGAGTGLVFIQQMMRRLATGLFL